MPKPQPGDEAQADVPGVVMPLADGNLRHIQLRGRAVGLSEIQFPHRVIGDEGARVHHNHVAGGPLASVWVHHEVIGGEQAHVEGVAHSPLQLRISGVDGFRQGLVHEVVGGVQMHLHRLARVPHG